MGLSESVRVKILSLYIPFMRLPWADTEEAANRRTMRAEIMDASEGKCRPAKTKKRVEKERYEEGVATTWRHLGGEIASLTAELLCASSGQRISVLPIFIELIRVITIKPLSPTPSLPLERSI